MHPIIGATSAAQVKDNLGASGVVLSDDQMRRLETATGFTKGYPHDFIAECDDHPDVYGTKRVTATS
ncbi:hypothetical protein [Kibdelosporangium philippinense]|uniref:hypothetical protein n=1 Tax=Kibdelosporangium philippinense TaxID=211113 RepID=UPI00361D0C46